MTDTHVDPVALACNGRAFHLIAATLVANQLDADIDHALELVVSSTAVPEELDRNLRHFEEYVRDRCQRLRDGLAEGGDADA